MYRPTRSDAEARLEAPMEPSEDFRDSPRWSVERDANVLEHQQCADLPRDPLFRLDVRKHEDGWATLFELDKIEGEFAGIDEQSHALFGALSSALA